MAEQEKILTHLEEVFTDMVSGLNGKSGGSLETFHKKSFSTLKDVRFPDRKHEDWRYTSVQKLMTPSYQLADHKKEYSVADIPELNSYVIPILNGITMLDQIDPALKTSGITIRSLYEAMEDSSLQTIFSQWLNPDKPTSTQAFEFLNFAFHAGGFFLEIPKNLILDKPIEIRILHDDPQISFSHPLFFIHASSGSSASIIERFEKNTRSVPANENGLINASGYIHLDKNASISHIKWQDLPEVQSLVYKLAISQNRDSTFKSFAFDLGGDVIRNNVEVELEESNTYTSLQAAYMAGRRQSMDHQTRINHKVPHCESHELYKGIVDEQASAAFNGKVYVHPDAQKTNAYQQNDTLVLSPHALMNSKPQLEIYADDVKCSHGATIGQLDEKAMFYLKARGISTGAAKHILKAAFLTQVLDTTPVPSIREYIRSRMSLQI